MISGELRKREPDGCGKKNGGKLRNYQTISTPNFLDSNSNLPFNIMMKIGSKVVLPAAKPPKLLENSYGSLANRNE